MKICIEEILWIQMVCFLLTKKLKMILDCAVCFKKQCNFITISWTFYFENRRIYLVECALLLQLIYGTLNNMQISISTVTIGSLNIRIYMYSAGSYLGMVAQ